MEQADTELKAISAIIEALNPLDPEARGRVLEYIFKRLNLAAALPGVLPTPSGQEVPGALAGQALSSSTPPQSVLMTGRQADIRSLREEKQPKSANEMAALVAYYLSELAPEGERRETIGVAEISKYFKQAKYPLPKSPRSTLPNARAAGYFDYVGRSQYRLNPVGHNLVVHGLPRGEEAPAAAKRPKSRKPSKTKQARGRSSKGSNRATARPKSQRPRSKR